MANLLIQVTPSEQAYKEAAKKWHRQLLLMPVLSMGDSTKYLTGLPGCRVNQFLGGVNTEAQFYPYAANKRGDGSTSIHFQELPIHFGAMNQDFVPNDYVQTMLGERAATLGDGQRNSDMAKLILSAIMKQAGENLALALFTAQRNASGNTTMDLFDGYATIAEAEIAAGNISVAKKNLIELTDVITAANAVDIMKDIEFGLDSRLRRQQRFCYCDPALVDLYNESYQLTHPTLNYNTSYEQPFVEGSNRRLTFAPMDGLAGSGLMFIAPKMNMVYGYDSMSDLERIEVLRLDVDTLTVAAKMFFGVQFRTLDFRFLKVVKLATALSGNSGGSPSGAPAVSSTVATPTFSPASWSEGETLTVELSTSTAGASIHYTTDGSTPTAESTLYDSTNKITLSATATVKAIAVKDGMTSSEVASKEYTKP